MKEAEIVNNDFINRSDTYNIALGGNGGTGKFINHKTTSERISAAFKTRIAAQEGYKPWNYGLKCPQIGNKPAETRKARGINYVGKNNPMYGIDVKTLMTEDANAERLRKISKANKGKTRSVESKKCYSDNAKKRKWLIHKDGTRSSTVDLNDPRLSDPLWQLGRVWKSKNC